ncbi:MAG: hypothetical protein HY897_04140 [Deltaproteobacteria bacterium]|nr:hypothetical protein [Deltaproteobacteria bacterium]
MKTRIVARFLVALGLGWSFGAAGCGDGGAGGSTDGAAGFADASTDAPADGDGGSTGDAGVPDAGPALPAALCGMPPYRLAPESDVGRLVRYEEIDLLNMDAESVDALLSQFGLATLSPVPYGSRVFRYRYTTQDRGIFVEATAMLGLPANAALPAGDLPLVAYEHGTSGFSDPCAPSRTLMGQGQIAILASLGFVVVAPDYVGMTGFGDASTAPHAYVVGEQAAIGSWDAVRAGEKLLSKLKTGLSVLRGVIPWGGSQGGHAALFMTLYQPYYATEYEVPALVAAVPPTDLLPLAKRAVSAYSPPTISFAAILTSMKKWYGAPPDVSGVFTDDAPYRFASTLEAQIFRTDKCDPSEAYKEIDDNPGEQRPDLVYQPGFIDAVLGGAWDAIEPWGCYLTENSLATTSVRPLRFPPTFMIYGEKDEFIVTGAMRDDFDRLCGLGHNLDYLECTEADHTEGVVWSLKEQVDWVRDRLAGGDLPPDRCTRRAAVCCSGTPAERCAGTDGGSPGDAAVTDAGPADGAIGGD